MAAVLAVALLLLCGNVHAQSDTMAYVTQVKSENTTHQAMAPASTSPTEGSSVMHNAVLANAENGVVDNSLALVDLARAQDLKAASPSPAEETAAPGPDPAESNRTGDAEMFANDPSAGGTLKNDGDYPAINENPDYSTYGVTGTGGGTPPSADASLATSDITDEAATTDPATGGTLMNDGDYPAIGSKDSNSYGVTGSPPSDASFATSDAVEGFATDPATGGTLKNDGEYPEISENPDYSTYGVTGTGGGSPPSDASLATSYATGDAFAADPATGGTLMNDGDYPAIGSKDPNSYGVTGSPPSDASLATSYATGDAFAADPTTGGTLKNDGDFPAISENPDYSTYGVTGTGGGSPPSDASLATSYATGDAFAADPATGGTLMNDGDYPAIGSKDPNSYGVTGSPPSDASLATSYATGDAFAADPATGGTLKNDGDFPAISENPDYSTYGVTGTGGGSPPSDASLATSYATGDAFAADPAIGGTLKNDGDFPAISENPDYSTYGVTGTGADSGPSGASLATLASKTYAPAPKSAPKSETWGQGNCTFYGGMDAAGTMSGACGYGNLYASGYGAYTAALSSALFKNGLTCGACYEVACSGNAKSCKPGSVLVTVTNFCPPNPGQSAGNGGWCNGANRHFELSYPAFVKIANPKAGVVPLKYRRVPCKKTGGIRFTLNGNCNFNLLTITNVGGSGVVTNVYMKGDGMDWAPMSRSWGANWQCSRNYCGKGITVKIVTSDKKVSVSRLAGSDWAFGKTYIGQQVY